MAGTRFSFYCLDSLSLDFEFFCRVPLGALKIRNLPKSGLNGHYRRSHPYGCDMRQKLSGKKKCKNGAYYQLPMPIGYAATFAHSNELLSFTSL